MAETAAAAPSPNGLVFVNWGKWQVKGGVAAAIRMRGAKSRTQGLSPAEIEDKKNKPFAMSYVIVATALDDRFESFADAVGGGSAESYFVRSLQYAGLHSGVLGEIRVPRRMFARIVLTRSWDFVEDAVGDRVFDSLLASGICGALQRSAPVFGTRSAPMFDTRSEHVANGCSAQVPPSSAHPPVLSCPVLSCPSPPVLSSSAREAPTVRVDGDVHDQRNGGGGSTLSNGTQNGAAKPPLTASDAAVWKALCRKYGPDLAGGKFSTKPGRDRWTRVLAAENDADAARRLIDEFTADEPDLVTKLRRPFRMGENDRRGGKAPR